jgi:hypothetical protein
MKAAKETEQLVGKFCAANKSYTRTSSEMDERVLGDALSAYKKSVTSKPTLARTNIRRIIMKSPITKLAAAAVIVIAVVLSINVWDKSIPTAYALDQTIQASHSTRYLHIKSFKANEDEPKEFWIEFYEDGEVKNVRMHMPAWDSPGDGAKVTVWKDNKAQVWFKKKKSLVTMRDKTVAAHTLNFMEELDPKLVVERLYHAQQHAQDEVEVEIDEPSNKAEPIVVTATCLPGSLRAGWRVVLFVDRATKLVTAMEFYKLKDGKYEYVELIEYYDYNQPIDPKMFTLDDEVPPEVKRIDWTTEEIGLAKGELTDKEIAVKVVREFYEAVIAKDHAKAGRIYGGVPAEIMEERWADLKVIRIISISEPIPHPTPGVGGFMVPCKLEIEKDGIKSVYEPYGPGVRPVRGQPNRWNIHGGVK